MKSVAPPPVFTDALATLREAIIDPALYFQEVPGPTRLAPWSASIEIVTREQIGTDPLGRATFTILYDPTEQDLWDSPFRLIGQARISIDEEQSTDPLLGEVVWKTFVFCLEEAGAPPHQLVGTVTRETSQSFGGLTLYGSTFNADLRCSWSPVGNNLAPHFSAWTEALRLNCGAMPHGVLSLGQHYG